MTPEGWNRDVIGNLFHVQLGKMLSKKAKTGSDEAPYLTNFNVQWSGIDTSQLNTMFFDEREKEKYRLKVGDLLICEGGEVGRSAIWRNNEVACYYQKALHRLRCMRPNVVLIEFALTYMEWLAGSSEIARYTTRSSIAHLTKDKLEKIQLLLPPYKEQAEIVRILTNWRDAIEICSSLIENARQQKTALAQQLLTGKQRLPGFSGASTHLTPIGHLPTDWEVVTIGRVATEVSVRNAEGKDHTVLACSKHVGFVKSLEYFKKQVFSDDLSGYKVIKRGQLGFPSNHVEEGSIGLQNVADIGLVSPIYTVFETASDQVDAGFLFKLFKTDHYRQRFAAATNASVDRRGSLRWAGFRSIKIPLPSLEEQKAIAKALDLAAELEAGYEAYREKLELEKRALMQQLLTGKRRVPMPTEAEA